MMDLDVEQFFYGGFDLFDPRIAEFDNIAGIGADHVIVLAITVGFFELGDIVPELVFPDEARGQEKLHRVVKRCATHTVVFILHLDVERLNIKMTFLRINLGQDRKALRCFSVPVFFQKIAENIFNGFL